MKAYLIVGIPGSGKTFLAQKMCGELGGIVIDDAKLKDYSNLPQSNVFITDPKLCFPKNREAVKKIMGDRELVWIYFENGPEKAIRNIKYRDDGRIVSASSIKDYWSKRYEIPKDVKVLEIWQE